MADVLIREPSLSRSAAMRKCGITSKAAHRRILRKWRTLSAGLLAAARRRAAPPARSSGGSARASDVLGRAYGIGECLPGLGAAAQLAKSYETLLGVAGIRPFDGIHSAIEPYKGIADLAKPQDPFVEAALSMRSGIEQSIDAIIGHNAARLLARDAAEQKLFDDFDSAQTLARLVRGW